MPTYQYVCTECGYGFDAVQAFTDDALTECPHCGGRLRKVFGAVGIVFKGSGFYRTDSRERDKAASKAGTPGADGKDVKAGKSSDGGSTGTSTGTDAPKKSESAGTSSGSSTAGSSTSGSSGSAA